MGRHKVRRTVGQKFGPFHMALDTLSASLGVTERTMRGIWMIEGMPRKTQRGWDEGAIREWAHSRGKEVQVPQGIRQPDQAKRPMTVTRKGGWKPVTEYDRLFGAPRSWADAEKRERAMHLRLTREREQVKLDRLRNRLLTVEQVQEEQTELVRQVRSSFENIRPLVDKVAAMKTKRERDIEVDRWIAKQLDALSVDLKEKEE